MKYFLDTEFIESFAKPFLGKRRHFIDLISIGIVAEDGREYYAISNEFDINKASKWVKENVIAKLQHIELWEHDQEFNKIYDGMEAVKKIGKSNKQIAQEIIWFINPHLLPTGRTSSDLRFDLDYYKSHNIKAFSPPNKVPFTQYHAQPEFYGYYADYDWVLFCSLFGTMMELPPGFPMYCRDIKQMVDQWVIDSLPLLSQHQDKAVTFEEGLSELKAHIDYPKETNEHNALADARWNHELYKFITS